MNEVDELLLEHFGVKGMHWGVHNTNREAKKDAKEFARAKQFFGEGAGTRRKLIKARVEGKSKKNPAYAKAFEAHLSKQDTSKHASKAVSERKRKDVVKKNTQRAGFLARKFTGEQGTQAAVAAAVLLGAGYLVSPRGIQARNKAVSKIKKLADDRARRKGTKFVADLLKPHM